jgi:ABC-type Mn2+/Zn2+ transport system ATPase subunit
MPQVRFNNCTLGYGRKEVLKEVDLTIYHGDFLWVIGPNGCGKTTFIKALLKLVPPLHGSIEHVGDVRFGYVMQRQRLNALFPLTAREVVSMARYPSIGLLGRFSRADREVVDRSLEIAGVAQLGRRLFRELSGGEQQRILVARALAADPNFLVLDEPTNDMDITAEAQMLQLLRTIHQQEKVTILMVSHLLRVIMDNVNKFGLVHDQQLSIHSREEMAREEDLSRIFKTPTYLKQVNGQRIIVVGE